MPAWPRGVKGARVVSERSWLPKPYEVLESLPAERRQKFIDRSADRLRLNKWLIQSTRDTIPVHADLLAQIERNHHEERRTTNENWVLTWMAMGPAPVRLPAGASPRGRTRRDSAAR